MKGLKSLRLPNWLIKSIQHGKENDDLGSILVNIGVFYLLMLVAYLVYSPFGSEYLALQIICAVAVLLILVVLKNSLKISMLMQSIRLNQIMQKVLLIRLLMLDVLVQWLSVLIKLMIRMLFNILLIKLLKSEMLFVLKNFQRI